MLRTVEKFSVECVDDSLARLVGVHACKADATTSALRVTQYPRRYDFTVGRKHRF